MSILVVEYPKPEPAAPQKKRTVIEQHPKPWQLGEAHESMCWIVDANHKRVTQIRGGGILIGPDSSDLARLIINAVNATDADSLADLSRHE